METKLKQLAEHLGKRPYDIKRSFDAIKKQKMDEGLAALPEEQLDHIAFLGTCKKYEVDPNALDKVVFEEPEETCKKYEAESCKPYIPDWVEANSNVRSIMIETGLTAAEVYERIQAKKEELKGFISDDGAIFIIASDLGVELETDIKTNQKEGKNMTNFFGDYEEPEDENDEDEPKFKPKINVKYTMRLTKPNEEPYKHEGVGKDGKDFESYMIPIELLNDPKGDIDTPAKTKLWLTDNHKPYGPWASFYKFWKHSVQSPPDNRTFTMEKEQKKSKNGNNYNVFTFEEA